MRRGLVLSSWNQWVVANGGDGEPTLEAIKVSAISSYLEGCRYHLCRDEGEELEERRRRKSLLGDLRGRQQGSRSDQRYHRQIMGWREMASDFLCDLYSLQRAADAISQRYFDDRRLLFPAHARSLARLVEVVEELVAGFNEGFACEIGEETKPASVDVEAANRPSHLDLSILQQAVTPAAGQHTASLVDMARAEALDAMGENQAAVAIVDRHV